MAADLLCVSDLGRASGIYPVSYQTVKAAAKSDFQGFTPKWLSFKTGFALFWEMITQANASFHFLTVFYLKT